MAYTKQNFVDGKKLTAEQLNNIENGIEQVESSIPTVPESLPNPNAITFTGAVEDTYDGSEAKTINIPKLENIKTVFGQSVEGEGDVDIDTMYSTFDSDLFEVGSIDYSVGAFCSHTKRIVMSTVQTALQNIYIKFIDADYMIDVAYYETATAGNDMINRKQLNGSSDEINYIIPQGSYYRIHIRKQDETDEYTPDISTFVNTVVILNDFASTHLTYGVAIQENTDTLNEYESVLTNGFIDYDYENKFPLSSTVGTELTAVGVTFKVLANGQIKLNGTSTSSFSFEVTTSGVGYYTVPAGTTMKMSCKSLSGTATTSSGSAANCYLFCSYEGATSTKMISSGSGTGSFTPSTTEDKQLNRFAINIPQAGNTYTDYIIIPYVAPTDVFYEDYTGFKKILSVEPDVISLENRTSALESTVGSLVDSDLHTNESEKIMKEQLVYTNENTSEADFRLVVFSDSHSFDVERYKKYSILNKTGLVDIVLGLGDFQAYAEKGKTLDKYNITQCLNAAGREPNCLYANGNHETGLIKYVNAGPLTEEWTLTKKEHYECLMKHLNTVATFDPENPYGGYYYIDYPAQKIRMIILNSSDVWSENNTLEVKYRESVMYQQRQITWFANVALDFSEKGEDAGNWSVLCGTHASYGSGMLSEILNAAKTGSSIDKTWEYKNRLLYVSDSDTWSGNDTTTTDTYSVSKDYSTQGAIHVIGVLFGHIHEDRTLTYSTIPWISFICDNSDLDNCYYTEVTGVEAGTYYYTAANGTAYSFTVSEAIADATRIYYNNYHSVYQLIYITNDNREILKGVTANPGTSGTLLENFTKERTEDTISMHGAAIVSINKDTKTITTTPYGITAKRTIVYEE